MAMSVLACATSTANAQEAMYTQAATMPSPGTYVYRTQFHLWAYGSNPADGSKRTEKVESMNTLAIGLVRDWALNIDMTAEANRTEDGTTGEWKSDKSIEEVDLMVKWRIYQNDRGGIDTERIALLGGVVFDNAQDDDLAGIAVSPHVGAVYTVVRGRHGFNQDLLFKLNTGGDNADNFGGEGPSDAIFFNSAYVYRFYPSRFRPDSEGAWYITAEMNGLYETNGDIELRWSPGVMYEGRWYAFEVMMQLPLWNEVDHRAELDAGFGFGFRFTF